jgi:hypothetical protein
LINVTMYPQYNNNKKDFKYFNISQIYVP